MCIRRIKGQNFESVIQNEITVFIGGQLCQIVTVTDEQVCFYVQIIREYINIFFLDLM